MNIVTLVNKDGSFKYEPTNKFINQNISDRVNSSVTSTPINGKVDVDLSKSVNILGNISTSTDVVLKNVSDNAGTLLVVSGNKSSLTWPGGSVVHGRPPTGDNTAFATVLSISDTIHVVWSVVDNTASPSSGTADTIQASVNDILGKKINLPPGGSVVSSDPESDGWKFTNLHSEVSYDLTLVAGSLNSTLYGESGQIDITYGQHGYKTVSSGFGLQAPQGHAIERGDGWVILKTPPIDMLNSDHEKVREANSIVDNFDRWDPETPFRFVPENPSDTSTEKTWLLILLYDPIRTYWLDGESTNQYIYHKVNEGNYASSTNNTNMIPFKDTPSLIEAGYQTPFKFITLADAQKINAILPPEGRE